MMPSKTSISLIMMFAFAPVVLNGPRAMAARRGGIVTTETQQSIVVIMLLTGDSQDSPERKLQTIAQITLSDLQAAWDEAGVGQYAWTEPPSLRSQKSPYPALYEIQTYVAFEYECHYNEIGSLLKDSQNAMAVVHSPAAKRALSVLVSMASRQLSLEQGITFRSKIIRWPPKTEIVPGLPEVK